MESNLKFAGFKFSLDTLNFKETRKVAFNGCNMKVHINHGDDDSIGSISMNYKLDIHIFLLFPYAAAAGSMNIHTQKYASIAHSPKFIRQNEKFNY